MALSITGGVSLTGTQASKKFNLTGPTWTLTHLPVALSLTSASAADPSFSTNGAMIVGGRIGGGGFLMYYSHDKGVTWTASTSNPLTGTGGGSPTNFCVRSNKNGMFVCYGNTGTAYVSSNGGVTWVQHAWAGAGAGGGNGFVYWDDSASRWYHLFQTSNTIWYSTDGFTTTSMSIGTLANITCGASNGAGKMIIAGASGATKVTLNGGSSWASGGTMPAPGDVVSMSYGNGVWVASPNALSGFLYYSTDDGTTWNQTTTFYGPNNAAMGTSIWADDLWIQAAGSLSFKSFDGITWTAANTINGVSLSRPNVDFMYNGGVYTYICANQFSSNDNISIGT